MIAVDSNLLAYAHREDSPGHEIAYARLVELAEGRAPWAIPWSCLHEFLATVTHPRIYITPTPNRRGISISKPYPPPIQLVTEGRRILQCIEI